MKFNIETELKIALISRLIDIKKDIENGNYNSASNETKSLIKEIEEEFIIPF